MPAQRLDLRSAALLIVPPLMWAGNAIVGRLMNGVVPPITLNFLRWALALLILLPWAGWVLRPGAQGMWPHWRRFALLGLLSVGLYNTFQYLALTTTTPINATLVAASMPVWMMAWGRLVYGVPISRRATLGAMLSIGGVVLVLSRGDASQLQALRLVPGDGWMLLAAFVWSVYSWQLARPPKSMNNGQDSAPIKADWAAFLLAQVVLGVAWSALMAGSELLLRLPHGAADATAAATANSAAAATWGWPLVTALVFLALGPSVLAYRCWGAGVGRVGPTTAGFFANLTPIFTAVLSTALLGEAPQWYHALGFVLIVAGIVVRD